MTAPRTHTRRDRRLADQVRRRQDPCGICGRPIDYSLPPGLPGSFEADHIVPVARGGESTLDQLQASHRACNRRKSDSMPGDVEHARPPQGALNAHSARACSTRGRCETHRGYCNPQLGVSFVTARRWTP